MTTRGRRAGLGALVTAAVAAATSACSAGPATTSLDSTAPVRAATTTAAVAAGAELEPKAILAATRPSVAFVTTPAAIGSAILLPSGHVVTNAHVVEPFAEVTLSFPDGPTIDRVPILGVDAWTDIAVLGPVRTDVPSLPIDDAGGLEQGDRIYMVGYPDETEKRPIPTITSGIVARIRSNADLGVTYLQTDATIAGGQSGGALVNGRGRVVGITGYSLDGFGIALSADDVAASVARIVDGKGDAYRTLPQGLPTTTTGTLRLDATHRTRQLYLGSSTDERTFTLNVGAADTPFQAYDTFAYEVFATNGLAEAQYLDALPPEQQAQERTQLALVTAGADGTYTLIVPAESFAVVSIGPFTDATATRDVTYTLDAPAHTVELDPIAPLAIGDTVGAVLNSFDREHGYSVALRQGESIDLSLTAPPSLLGLIVDGPGVDPAGDTPGSFTETDGTIFDGVTAKARFTAPADGTFTVFVVNEDVGLFAYELTIS